MPQRRLHHNGIVDAVLHKLDGQGIEVLMGFYGIDEQGFARIVGVKPYVVSSWISGEAVPDDKQRRVIGRQMNTPLFEVPFFRGYLEEG